MGDPGADLPGVSQPADLTGWPAVQELIDALPFYVLLVDAGHTVLAANRTTREHLGLSPEQVVGHYCPKVIHDLDGPFPGCPLEQAVKDGCYVEREVQDAARGTWYLSSVAPTQLRSAADKPVFVHFVRDITELKKTSGELARSLEQQRAVTALLRRLQACRTSVEVLEEVTAQILSLSWIELTASAAGFLVQGEQLSLAVQRNFSAEQARRCGVVPFGRCLCGKAAVDGEVRFCTQPDEEHAANSADQSDHGHLLLPMRHAGRTLAVLSFYLPPGAEPDLTRLGFLRTVADLAAVAFNRLRMQAQVVQMDRLVSLGVLAGIVGHEIRTPLNVLSINLQLLGRTLRGEGELARGKLQEQVELMTAEVGRIDAYLEAPLLALGRQQLQELQPLDLNEELTGAITFLEPEARRKQVELVQELAPGLPPVLADGIKLRRILLELLLNGIQASNQAGAVQLVTRPRRSAVELVVEHAGAAMSWLKRGELDVIPSTAEDLQGRSLGLTICARLAREMRGKLTVDPGATVQFVLTLAVAG